MKQPMPRILRGDARQLPLPDNSVDLIVTSPPYFGLRSYTDGGEHYDGQIGSEPTPAEFIDALIECTREMVRVLKPSGSIFVNLGDKYGPDKSLLLLPEEYRLRARNELGLIARAVIVWAKPNGLPESVTDRVRRSHEDWVHLTVQPRYFAAVDEIREPQNPTNVAHHAKYRGKYEGSNPHRKDMGQGNFDVNPLGKLPGSVWEIATQPLKVPASLGVDHFAAFPMEWPRRLIQGWCPREVCVGCGEGRRPVTEQLDEAYAAARAAVQAAGRDAKQAGRGHKQGHAAATAGAASMIGNGVVRPNHQITGYVCACPDTSAATTPGTVLDPFSGTGTTALVATMLGRTGIGVDLSSDYNRLAEWRANDPKERARAAGLDPDEVAAIRPQLPGQGSLLDLLDGDAS